MGACTNFTTITARTPESFKKKYNKLMDEQRDYYGSNPYSGQLCAKPRGFKNVSYKFNGKSLRGKNEQIACDIIEAASDKWDAPAYINVGNKYLIGGWCPC
jgi:hypothetical protein